MLVEKSGRGATNTVADDDAGDKMLVQRMGSGDQLAFRQLVDRHLSSVLGVARRMLRDDAEAEDDHDGDQENEWVHADDLTSSELEEQARVPRGHEVETGAPEE